VHSAYLPEETDADRLASDLTFIVTRLRSRMREEGHLLEHGYSLAQLTLLSRICDDGPMSIAELGAVEHIRPQSAAQTARILIEGGLVSSEADPDDRRRVQLMGTAEGYALMDRLRRSREGWLAGCITRELSMEERQGLRMAVGLLHRISQHGAV
jgi:DNA-binding MarR family transcriptional regulator